jgi:cell division protein FtsZ
MAINSPLLEDISISGARGLLMNITGPSTITMDEVDEASNYIKKEVNKDAEIFWGVVLDDGLKDDVQVTVIATGIDNNGDGCLDRIGHAYSNVVKIRDVTPEEAEADWTVKMNGESLDTPTFQRKGAEHPSSMKEDGHKDAKKGILHKLRLKDNLDSPTFFRAKAD